MNPRATAKLFLRMLAACCIAAALTGCGGGGSGFSTGSGNVDGVVYSLRGAADGYVYTLNNPTATQPAGALTVTAAAQPAAAYTPVAGAQVLMVDPALNTTQTDGTKVPLVNPQWQATTTAAGFYSIPNVVSGQYRLRVTPSGGQAEYFDLTVAGPSATHGLEAPVRSRQTGGSGQTTSGATSPALEMVVFPAPPADASLAPVPGVTVSFAGAALSTRTNLAGAYTFFNIGAGTYTLQLRKTGFAPRDLAIAVVDGRTTHGLLVPDSAVNTITNAIYDTGGYPVIIVPPIVTDTSSGSDTSTQDNKHGTGSGGTTSGTTTNTTSSGDLTGDTAGGNSAGQLVLPPPNAGK